MKKEEILIFGAGALGLGFLGPEFYQDYKLTFIDNGYKKYYRVYRKLYNHIKEDMHKLAELSLKPL